jgi:hypothetical protein
MSYFHSFESRIIDSKYVVTLLVETSNELRRLSYTPIAIFPQIDRCKTRATHLQFTNVLFENNL